MPARAPVESAPFSPKEVAFRGSPANRTAARFEGRYFRSRAVDDLHPTFSDDFVNRGMFPVTQRLILSIPAMVTVVAVALVLLLFATMAIPVFVTLVMAVVAAVVLAVVLAVFLTAIALLALIIGNVLAGVPVVLDEVDPLPAGMVLVAILAPVLGVAGWNVQVDRRAHDRYPLDDDRLRVDQLRRRIAANVDAAIEAGLADAYRDANVGGKRWRGGDDQCGGKEEMFHAGPVLVAILT